MKDYYDAPDEYLCPICREEDCEGCPGAENWFDEPDSIWDEPEQELMTREDYAIIEYDIYLEKEEEVNDYGISG